MSEPVMVYDGGEDGWHRVYPPREAGLEREHIYLALPADEFRAMFDAAQEVGRLRDRLAAAEREMEAARQVCDVRVREVEEAASKVTRQQGRDLAAAEACAKALERERDGWRDARRESEAVIAAIGKAAGPRAEEHDIIEHVAALQARADAAVAALRFYADRKHYRDGATRNGTIIYTTIYKDEGAKARAALLTPAPTPPATMPPVVLCEAHKGCEIDPRPFCPYCFGTAEYAAGRDERKRRDATPPAPASGERCPACQRPKGTPPEWFDDAGGRYCGNPCHNTPPREGGKGGES